MNDIINKWKKTKDNYLLRNFTNKWHPRKKNQRLEKKYTEVQHIQTAKIKMSYIIRQNHTITLLSNQKINTHKVNGNIKKKLYLVAEK